MTNAIAIFNFNQNQVRTQTIDEQPFFCLSDCCKALGIRNGRDVISRLKGVGKTDILTKGGKQEATFINEPNLYRLIFRSNKPQAQAFADWVYNEVLPTIRKTGSYGVPAVVDRKAIGGIVKRCASAAVREELAKYLVPQKVEDDGEFEVWRDIISATLSARMKFLLEEEKKRLVQQVSDALKC